MSGEEAIENHCVAMNIKAYLPLSVCEKFHCFNFSFCWNLQCCFNTLCNLIFALSHPLKSLFSCRFQKPTSCDDDDLDSSYFRRKPTSFLSSNDAKRYTWMAPDDESVRMEGPRPIQHNGGPYVVGSYPPKSSFLSQSSEQITG